MAAARREPDLAGELDRADEAAETEVDVETPSPAQQRQQLRAHVNLWHPPVGEFCHAFRSGRCRRGVVRWVKRYFKCPECEARRLPRTRTAAALPKCYRFNQVCGIDTIEVRKSVGSRKPNSNISRHLLWDAIPQGSTQDMTATETFSTLRQFWLKHFDAMEVLIMDQGREFDADFQHLCQSRDILPVVTDLETPWKNSVVERWSPFQNGVRESVQSGSSDDGGPSVNELIDFTFAELNRRVERA